MSLKKLMLQLFDFELRPYQSMVPFDRDVLLQSQLFSGDMKLEAAAVSDSAHIVPGAIGEHVRKIQLGLIQVNGASLSPDGVYGAAKAAAVHLAAHKGGEKGGKASAAFVRKQLPRNARR